MSDYDAIASAFDAALAGPMREVVTSLRRTSADVWRNVAASGGKTAAPVLHGTGLMIRLATPDASTLQLLADLGAERADRIVRAAWDADVSEGDELHIGAVVYQIERVARAADKTLVAVWEIRGAAAATDTGTVLLDDRGLPLESG